MKLNENKSLNQFMQVIQVDFEGRNPMTSDFHGIRQLLHQLFLKSDINLSELADIVTGMFARIISCAAQLHARFFPQVKRMNRQLDCMFNWEIARS